MVAIKDIKKGAMDQAAPAFDAAVSSLETQGAKAVVIACTELSLLSLAPLPSLSLPLPQYDAADILARAIIRACKEQG